MSALPLAKYSRFATEDLEFVRHAMTRAYCDHGLRTAAHLRKINARHHQVELGAVSLNYLSYGADISVSASPLGEFFLVDFPLTGHANYRIGEREFVSRGSVGAIASPSHGIRSEWSADCQLVTVKVDRRALERFLSAILERTLSQPLCFEPEFDFSRGASASFRALIDFLIFEIDHGDCIRGEPAWQAQMERAVMAGLLAAQRNNYSDALQSRTSQLAPRYLRRAEAFIRENLGNEIRVEDVVAAAQVPTRTLFAAYKRYYGTPPIAHFRELRLQRAHEDLQKPGPDDTVASIACRWGFANFGHFSRYYYECFGEKPSETLARSR